MTTIPQGWEVVPLEACAEITNSNVDKKTVDGETIVKLCNYMDVYSNTKIDRSINFMIASATDLEIEKFTLQKDDVIITKDSESPDDIGIPAYVSENLSDVICGYHLTLVRPNEICNGKFLSIALSSDRYKKYYGKLASGSTRYALSMGTLNNTPILLPPLSEQQKIAEILSGIDRSIEATQTLIDKEKMIKKGLMSDLLNHGIDEEGRIRTPQTHRYIESPLGMIPDGWEVKRLGEISKTFAGGTPDRGIEAYYKGHIPWVKSGEVNQTKIYDTEEKITDEAIKNSSAKLIKKNTILVAMYGATAGQIAHLKIDACSNQAVLAVPVEKDCNDFVFYALSWAMPKLLFQAQGSGQPNLSKQLVDRTLLLMPRLSEQQKIAEILSAQDRKIDTEEANLAKLQNLKKGLMGDLLSGKVRGKV